MNANQAAFPVRKMCQVLKISASGFDAWRKRPPSRRALEDAVLSERIRAIHAASDGNYGSPNIHAELRDEGTRVGLRISPGRIGSTDLDLRTKLNFLSGSRGSGG